MPLASCPSTNKGVVFSQNAIVWHQIWCVHARWWTGTTGQKFMKTYMNESCAQLFSELAGTVPAGCQLSWHRHFAHISFHTFLHKMYLHCKRLHTEKKQFHNVLFSAFYSNLKTTRSAPQLKNRLFPLLKMWFDHLKSSESCEKFFHEIRNHENTTTFFLHNIKMMTGFQNRSKGNSYEIFNIKRDFVLKFPWCQLVPSPAWIA